MRSENLIGSVLKQLSVAGLVTQDDMDVLLEKYAHTHLTLDEDDMVSVIEQTIHSQPAIHILIDGIDECDESNQDRILDFVGHLVKEAKTPLKCIAFCREEGYAWKLFKVWPCLKIHGELVADDIRLFVDNVVQAKISEDKLHINTDSLKAEVVDTLCAKSDGM